MSYKLTSSNIFSNWNVKLGAMYKVLHPFICCKQCCGYGSALIPDPDSHFIWNVDFDPVGPKQNGPQNCVTKESTVKNVLFCFEVLDAIFLGFAASLVDWTSFMDA